MIQTPTIVEQLHYGNLPILRYQWRDLTIEGYSRAAVQTYWRFPQLRLLMDHGAHSWDFAGIGDLCLTHMHPDHSAGLISYLASRSVLNTAPPKVYLHPAYEQDVRALIALWSKMMNDELPCELVLCQAGDRIPFGQKKEIEVFAASHVIPCQGYMVQEVHHKLKEPFAGKSGDELKTLKAQGVAIETVKRTPRIAFCGDTTIDVLRHNPQLAEVEILILEMTFGGDAVDAAHARKYGHVHWDEFLEYLPQLNNQLIIGSHFSSRMSRDQTLELLEKKLPLGDQKRFVAWL